MPEWKCARGRETYTDEELEETGWKCPDHPKSYLYEISPPRVGPSLRPLPFPSGAARYIIGGRIVGRRPRGTL